MTHQICDACECVSLCSKSGCRPLVPVDQAPVVTSSTDPKYLREALDKTFELLVRERETTKELARALRNVIGWVPGREVWHTDAPEDAVLTARALLSKVPQ